MSVNVAAFGSSFGTSLSVITDDLGVLDTSGKWFVAGWFEGPVLAFKFENWSTNAPEHGNWAGPSVWTSDFNEQQYVDAVESAKSRIAAGDVYEVNICRRLSAQWPVGDESDSLALYRTILHRHPASMAAYLRVNDPRLVAYGLPETVEIISASPELFLQRTKNQIISSPIKGTAPTAVEFLEKDISENVMIVDLVRNDLSMVCEVASIHVPQFLERHEIPGISHLVTTVAGRLKKDVSWSEILSATFPPGSVTGAPKSSALQIISEVEAERNIYCGTLGIVDADNQIAELSVAIRTFWRSGDEIKFGTGAGITWGSSPAAEWLETELKAARLIKIASGVSG